MILRGREFTESEIGLIQQIIREHPNSSRRHLSFLICEQLNWRQPNGHLKDRACRDVLLRLEKQAIIGLPNPLYELTTQSAGVKNIDFQEPEEAISADIRHVGQPIFKVVEEPTQRKLWNYLADEPTGNLDSRHGAEVMELLADLNEAGTTIVMVTHSPAYTAYGHRIIHLFDGHVVTENIQEQFYA